MSEEDNFPPGATKERQRINGADVLQQPQALDWPNLATREPPDRRWAINGWLGFGHVTLLIGPGGIGKTLISQQIGSCLALKRDFIEPINAHHRVLMWACEDDHDELWRRQLQIARWCKAGLEEFHELLTIVPRHGLENSIATTEFGKLMFTPRIEELRQQAHDLQADVVILDNVGQLYGAGENDRHAVTAFLNALVGALHGKAILLLGHPSRGVGSEFSGSSAWENVARTRLYFGATLPSDSKTTAGDEEPADNVRYLSRRKANYSPKDWRRLTYANGALTPDEPEGSGGIIAHIKAGNARKAIVASIQTLASRGIRVAEGQRSPNFLPRLMADYKLDDGIPQRELTNEMRSMLIAGEIEKIQVGKDGNRNPIFSLSVK